MKTFSPVSPSPSPRLASPPWPCPASPQRRRRQADPSSRAGRTDCAHGDSEGNHFDQTVSQRRSPHGG